MTITMRDIRIDTIINWKCLSATLRLYNYYKYCLLYEKYLNLVSFNCNEIKSSMSYISHLLEVHDILFLCEHWLLPGEIRSIVDNFFRHWCHMKSSVCPETPGWPALWWNRFLIIIIIIIIIIISLFQTLGPYECKYREKKKIICHFISNTKNYL